MNTSMRANARRCVLSALTLTAGPLVCAAALAGEPAGAEHITVEAERPYLTKGRTDRGTPVEVIEMRARVDYSDLDPSIPSNAAVLRQRVQDAARVVCADLQKLYPNSQDDNCVFKAQQNASRQVNEVITAAQTRKDTGR